MSVAREDGLSVRELMACTQALLGTLDDGRKVRCHLYPVSTPAGVTAAAPAS